MMKLTIIALLLFICLLWSMSQGAPIFNLSRWLQNSRTLKRSQLDEEDIANLTKEELYEIFWRSNLSFPIEPPPPSESGSGDIESGESVECREDEFTCKDGDCIPMKKVCDKKFHCKDKSDEEKSYCKKCTVDQFTCDNGNCISIYHRCDGDNDCNDGSDEDRDRCLAIDCPRPSNIHCPSNGVCIETLFLCDRIMDCPDNWDERACPN